jgi:hypothetical protein
MVIQMVVREINNIRRKHMLISYRREYHADVHISLRNQDAKPFQIEFSLEMTPLGGNIVRVKMIDEPDYPLVPLMNEIKERIAAMDREDALPR